MPSGSPTPVPGRPVLPTDVARAALFLIEGATTMTGELIRLDAGELSSCPRRASR